MSVEALRLELVRRAAVALAALVVVDVTAAYGYHRFAMAAASSKAVAADAAVVLYAGADSAGNPDAESQRRIHHALQLLETGLVQAVVFSGGAGEPGAATGAEAMRTFALSKGAQPARLHVEPYSYDTISNLRQAATLGRRLGWTSLLIVGSPLHLLRTRREVPPGMMSFRFSPYPVAHARPPIRALEIWRQVHHEWLAFAGRSLLSEALYDRLIRAWRAPRVPG